MDKTTEADLGYEWVVGRVDKQPLPNGEIIQYFKTHDAGSEYIDTLPDHEKGIYFLDGPEATYTDPQDDEPTMKSGAQYVKEAGCCPRCDSDQIEGGSIDVEGPVAWQRISCTACGLDYQDTYTLSGYLVQNGAGFNEYNATPLGRPITDAQRDTILAALRLWQELSRDDGLDTVQGVTADLEGIKDIATNGGIHPELTREQIDELCSIINPIPGDTPTVAIAIHVAGGIVSVEGSPARVYIVDHDTDGIEEENLVKLHEPVLISTHDLDGSDGACCATIEEIRNAIND